MNSEMNEEKRTKVSIVIPMSVQFEPHDKTHEFLMYTADDGKKYPVYYRDDKGCLHPVMKKKSVPRFAKEFLL